jgi:hypothetical protein
MWKHPWPILRYYNTICLMKGQNLNIRSQDLNQLVAPQSELPKSVQGLNEQKSYQTVGIRNWTQTGKGTHTWTLCQKIKGSTETRERPIKMDIWAIYRTLSSKRTPFQIGTGGQSHSWNVPRGRWISNACPMWPWGYSSFMISSPGPVVHRTKWQLWCPYK